MDGIRIFRPGERPERVEIVRRKLHKASGSTDRSLPGRILRSIGFNPLRRMIMRPLIEIPLSIRLRKLAAGLRANVYHAHDLDTLSICEYAASRNSTQLVYDSHELWLNSSRYLTGTSAHTEKKRGRSGKESRCSDSCYTAEGREDDADVS